MNQSHDFIPVIEVFKSWDALCRSWLFLDPSQKIILHRKKCHLRGPMKTAPDHLFTNLTHFIRSRRSNDATPRTSARCYPDICANCVCWQSPRQHSQFAQTATELLKLPTLWVLVRAALLCLVLSNTCKGHSARNVQY